VLYQLFFERSLDIMFISQESDGRIIKANDAAVEAYGYNLDELLEMRFHDLFNPEVLYTIEPQKAGVEGCISETEQRRKDGSTFPAEVSLKTIATGEGRVLLCVVRDITKRNLTVEEIRKVLSKELDKSAALADLSGKLLSPASIEEISAIVLEHAQWLTESKLGYVGYIERKTGYLNCSTLTREIWDKCEIEDKSTIFNKLDDLGGWVLKNKEPILTNQPRQDPRSAGLPPGHIPIERLLSVPAIYDGNLLGIISLANSPRDYDEQDLALVKRLAALFAIAVQRKWSEDDLRQSEEELRRAHQRLVDIIESLPDATFVVDRDKKVIAWNQGMEELTGTRKEDIIGKSDYAYAVPLYGKPRPIMIDLLFEGDPETELLYDYVRKEGNSYYAEAFLPYLYGGRGAYLWGKISRLVDRDGNETGAIESIHDITERKLAEAALITERQRFETLVRNAPFGIVLIEKDSTISYINPKFKELFGYDPADIPNADEWFQMAYPDPDYRKEVIDAWVNDVKDGKPGEKLQRTYTVTCRDRTKRIVSFITVELVTGEQLMTCEDITERKRTEQAFRESEAHLKRITDNMLDMISQTDLEGIYQYVSPSHKVVLGYEPNYLLGKSVFELVHPDDLITVITASNRAIETKMPGILVYRYRHARGHYLWLETVGNLLFDNNGQITGAIFCGRDITTRKLAEEKLQDANQQLLDIIDFLPDATFVIDLGGKVIAWNRTIEEITGVRKEAILGKGDYAYAVPFYGEPRPILIDLVFVEESEVKLQYDYVRREEGTFYGETFVPFVYSGKGAFLWGKASPLFDKDGNIVGAIESIHDISGLKHLEEIVHLTGNELRLALEKLDERELIDRIIQTSPAGIVLLNCEREITYANIRAMQVLGLRKDSTTQRVYRTPGRLFVDYEGNPIPDEDTVFRRVMVTGQSFYDIPQAIEWPDGTRTMFSVNGAPLFDRSGRIEGAVLSIEDVTERKKAEKRISTYQRQLRSLTAELSLVEERERRRIAEGIHDHIGQSLAVTRLKLGALKKASSFDTILRNLDEIVALIEVTIQNTRSLTFELSPPILYDLGFEAAVEWLGEQVLEKNGVEVSLENELQPKSLDEEVRIILFTAVRELFFNIIKHARAQKVFISIQDLGEKILVTVKDDGIGFETHLCGPGKTAGFGLFSIKERLEHLGGRLEIISRPGFGTSVAIEAPLKNGY
jgi:PAS domain S-box-containing protein